MRMPAESAPHERTVMCWPARRAIYGELMPDAEAAHALVASTIARFEPVTVIANPGSGERAAQVCTPASADGFGVDIVELPIDDSWFRDSGPIYVTDGDRRLALDWTFNAWGRSGNRSTTMPPSPDATPTMPVTNGETFPWFWRAVPSRWTGRGRW